MVLLALKMEQSVFEQTSWVIGSIAVRLGRLSRVRVSRPPEAPARNLTLTTEDGLMLAATYWPGARADSPAVLIVHGYTGCRQDIEANAQWLAQHGYGVLTIDLRGHGGSSDAPCGFGWPESQDVHAAAAWLRRQQHGAKLAFIGISMGGAAALLGPRGPVPCDALVLQAVFPDIHHAIRSRFALVGGRAFAARLEPLLAAQAGPRIGVAPGDLAPRAAVARVQCPVLVIGGEKDVFTPPAETKMLFEAAPAPKSLLVLPRLGHDGVSKTKDRTYRERLLLFLRETIGGPDRG